MGHHRRARPALIGATLLAGGLAAGTTAIATAGASASPPAAAPAATSDRFAASLGITIQGQPVRVTMSGVASATEADLRLGIPGTSIEVRRIGQTLYVDFPPGTKGTSLPAGKSWGAVSLAAFERKVGIPLPGLGSSGQGSFLSPGAVLSSLSAVTAGPPRKVGTATIHGMASTAYSATIDLAKVAKSVPASQAASLKQLLGAAKLSNLPLTVWVNAAGRLVQLHAAFPFSFNLVGTTMSLKLDVLAQEWDFGAPVHVSAPPASQVAQLPTSALGGSALGLGLGGLGLG